MLRRMVRKRHQRHVATGLDNGNSFYGVTNNAFLMGEFGVSQLNITDSVVFSYS